MFLTSCPGTKCQEHAQGSYWQRDASALGKQLAAIASKDNAQEVHCQDDDGDADKVGL